MSQFQLITAWEDITRIQETLKERDALLVTINRKYFRLIEQSHFIKKVLTVKSNEIPMNFENSFYLQTTPAKYDGVLSAWANYEVDFFNTPENIVTNLNSEIVLSTPVGNEAFRLHEPMYTATALASKGRYTQSNKVYTRVSDDHMKMSQSLFLHLPVKVIAASSQVNVVKAYDFPLPVFFSQLMLQFYNPNIWR